jgi:hypothetical protein
MANLRDDCFENHPEGRKEVRAVSHAAKLEMFQCVDNDIVQDNLKKNKLIFLLVQMIVYRSALLLLEKHKVHGDCHGIGERVDEDKLVGSGAFVINESQHENIGLQREEHAQVVSEEIDKGEANYLFWSNQ